MQIALVLVQLLRNCAELLAHIQNFSRTASSI